jgi:hypothetical protein
MYYWWWHDFVCRLEPYTYEFRRHVAKWWWLDIVFFGIGFGVFLWMLLYPLSGIGNSWRITLIALGACGMAFFGWLLLHLGGFCVKAINGIKKLILG